MRMGPQNADPRKNWPPNIRPLEKPNPKYRTSVKEKNRPDFSRINLPQKKYRCQSEMYYCDCKLSATTSK